MGERPGLARILLEGVCLFLCSDARERKIEMLDQGWGLGCCGETSYIDESVFKIITSKQEQQQPERRGKWDMLRPFVQFFSFFAQEKLLELVERKTNEIGERERRMRTAELAQLEQRWRGGGAAAGMDAADESADERRQRHKPVASNDNYTRVGSSTVVVRVGVGVAVVALVYSVGL